MTYKTPFALIAAACFAAGLPAVAQAAAPADAAPGRALVQRYADAVVGIELVVTLKIKMGDREMPPRPAHLLRSWSRLRVTEVSDQSNTSHIGSSGASWTAAENPPLMEARMRGGSRVGWPDLALQTQYN